MKKQFAAILAAVFLVMTIAAPVNANKTNYLVGDFYDLQDSGGNKHWAYEQMSELVAMGILKGYTQKVYDRKLGRNITVQTAQPGKNITRAEFAVILSEALNLEPVTGQAAFQDDIPAWAEPAINTLFDKGIIKGNPDGTFRPQRSISRAEITTMLVLAANRNSQLSNGWFWDVPASHWAYNYIQTAAIMGFVSGLPDGRFAPNRNASRAEVMAMLFNFLQNSRAQMPGDVYLVSRADLVSDGMESVFNDDEGADINQVIPYLTGEMEEYMTDGESRIIIDNLKSEGLLGYRINSSGKVVRKSEYLAEVAYGASVTFKNEDIYEEVNTPLHYYLMKVGKDWYVYKENFE